MFRASETLLYAFTVNHENIPSPEQSVKRVKQKIGEQNGTPSRYAQGKQEKKSEYESPYLYGLQEACIKVSPVRYAKF